MKLFTKYLLAVTLFLLFFTTSCKKSTKQSLQIESFTVEKGNILRGIHFINDSTGFICGGKRNTEGYIYKTTDGGVSWSKTNTTQPKCIYDISFINDSVGFAGGDFLYLLKTTNSGKDWVPYNYGIGELPYHEQNRPAIKNFSFRSNNEGYFVGGENYNKGVLYKTFDGGLSWSFDTIKQEIMSVQATLNTVWASGFGYVGNSVNGTDFKQKEITNEVFSGIYQLNDNSIITICKSGRIYKSSDNGGNWKVIRKKSKVFSKQIALNDIVFNENKGVIVGGNGFILISDDYGDSWRATESKTKASLNSVIWINGQFLTVTENGEMLAFSF